MESHTGSLRTRGEKAGVIMASLRWSWGRTCVVSFPTDPSLSNQHAPYECALAQNFFLNKFHPSLCPIP
jgi:hypothetical protein